MKKIIIIGLTIILLITSYAVLIEPNLLFENKLTIHSKKIKSPIKIVLLSDIHAPISNILFNKIIHSINNFSPEIILIAGDINAHLKPKKSSIEFLNKLYLKTNKRIYMVLGDSDVCSKYGQCISCQIMYNNPPPKINAIILRDSTVYPINNISLSGLDFFKNDNWTPPNFTDTISDTVFKIFLLHNTINISRKYFSNFDLSLSGNTHGGQIFGGFAILSKFRRKLDKRFIKGIYYCYNKPLFVSSGIGMSFLPIRFGIPPEIVLIKLKGIKNE